MNQFKPEMKFDIGTNIIEMFSWDKRRFRVKISQKIPICLESNFAIPQFPISRGAKLNPEFRIARN